MGVRKIRTNDLDGFYDLFVQVNAEGRFSPWALPPSKQVVARALADVKQNDWAVYVVEERERIIGSAEAYPESFCRNGGDDRVAILGMQVQREQRGKGHGRRLLTAVIDHCEQDGFKSVELAVLKSNAPAIALYEQAGFTWVEDLDTCRMPDGRQDQPQRMRRVL